MAALAGGGASAAIDLRTRRVPNLLTLTIGATGILLATASVGSVSLGGAFAGLVLGIALMLPGHFIGATGAGDVKLFGSLGTLLGPQATLVAFLYTAIAGGLLAVVVALRRRRLWATVERTSALVRTAGANVADIERESSDNRFAYAPAIAVGAVLAALWM
jgi:prepilin peptidase CpaA